MTTEGSEAASLKGTVRVRALQERCPMVRTIETTWSVADLVQSGLLCSHAMSALEPLLSLRQSPTWEGEAITHCRCPLPGCGLEFGVF